MARRSTKPTQGKQEGDAPDKPKRARRASTKRPARKASPPRRGRPPLLDARRQQIITDAIRMGNYEEVAARKAGISEASYYKWKARGRVEVERLAECEEATGEPCDPLPDEQRYLEFLQAVEAALTDSEATLVQNWRAKAIDDWRAAKELLARRHSDRWGPRSTVELDGSVRTEGGLSAEDRAALLAEIAALGASWGPGSDEDG